MQKSQNILYFKGIGEVYFTRNSRARNLSIRINQQGEVKVTVPRFVSQKRAELFFRSKHQWVLKKLNDTGLEDCKKRMPAEGECIRIRDRDFPVRLVNGDEDIESAIWRILKEEALGYLPQRVSELVDKHGFTISGLKLRKMKTRWGSCTAKNSINLNTWLLMLPPHLSDYVILHELVHTRVPDHSHRFWDELDRVTGGQSRSYRRELRSYRIMCFPEAIRDQ